MGEADGKLDGEPLGNHLGRYPHMERQPYPSNVKLGGGPRVIRTIVVPTQYHIATMVNCSRKTQCSRPNDTHIEDCLDESQPLEENDLHRR